MDIRQTAKHGGQMCQQFQLTKRMSGGRMLRIKLAFEEFKMKDVSNIAIRSVTMD